MPRTKCAPDCTCGLHHKTAEHRARIGMAVSLTAHAKGLSTHPKTVYERERQRRSKR